jgi:hypothetical protein
VEARDPKAAASCFEKATERISTSKKKASECKASSKHKKKEKGFSLFFS